MGDDQDFANLVQTYRKRFKWTQTELAKRMGVPRNRVTELETRQKTPNQPQILQLARIFELEDEERKAFLRSAHVKESAAEEGIWNVPHNRNLFFTGHENILLSLRKRLAPGRAIRTFADTLALSGLGGIGKTQIAVEYAYHYASEYDAVLWLPADTMEIMIAACFQLAETVLGLPEQVEAIRQVEAIKGWLQTHHRWLLVLDNVENPQEILATVVPQRHRGSVLITTRMQNTGPLARVLKLPLFSQADAELFLLRRAGLIALDATADTVLFDDRQLATSLCTLMDRLPLALDQAGAYIAENGCSIKQYIVIYHECRQDLLDRRRAKDLKQIPDHAASVLMTFRLSWERVQLLDTLAGKALQFCAFLAPDQIPEEIVQTGVFSLDVEESQNIWKLDEALGLLHRYSLIERRNETLSLHRLVQEVMQEVSTEEERQKWMERAVLVVNAVFPDGEYGVWPLCEFLLPHALTCAKWISVLRQKKPEGARLLVATGRYLYERAQYREAELFYQRALAFNEEQLGTTHPTTILTLNNLAVIYQAQGRYGEAEPLYQRALAFNEEQLGATHPDIAGSLAIAAIYRAQGRYGEAEPLYQRALALDEKQLGATHPTTALGLNNLASLYQDQDRYEEAESLYQRALAIHENQLEHFPLQTATNLGNLAHLYQAQGRYEEAEPLYQRALAIREELLEGIHPDITRNLGNLASLYKDQGRYEEAEPLYQRVIALCEEQLGASHPDTAISLSGLAHLYQAQGRYEEAEPLYQRALTIYEKQLGSFHPHTPPIRNNLANLYQDQGRYEEVESLYQRGLAIHENQLRSVNLDTLVNLKNLVLFYTVQGRYEEAEPLYQRIITLCEEQLGASHPDTVTSLDNLAELYVSQERYTEAEPLHLRALSIREEVLGTSHPNIAANLNNLAYFYIRQGRYIEAEPLLHRAATISLIALGREHPQTQPILLNHLTLLSQMYANGDLTANHLTLLSQMYANGDLTAFLQLLELEEQEDNETEENSQEE